MATKLSVTLLIDEQSRRVLLAEAEKDFIDFLFSLLKLPLGSVTNLLTNRNIPMVGCIGRLHESVQNLSNSYIKCNKNKKDLLNPHISLPLIAPNPPPNPPIFLKNDPSIQKKYYSCPICSRILQRYFTDLNGLRCPDCGRGMSNELTYVGLEKVSTRLDSDESGGGYVKGEITYMVMDDLTVTPMSTFSTLDQLKKLNVRDVSVVEEKVVEVGMKEGLALLKASLRSKTVLTDVFLFNQVKEETYH